MDDLALTAEHRVRAREARASNACSRGAMLGFG
jgi:hypothetical protein